MKADQEFAVIRPRGRFRSTFTKKKGPLGIYTEDAGRLRVVSVKEKTSVALVTRACGMILLGDLLREVPPPVEMPASEGIATFESGRQPMLDRFADPSGKQTGRIVLARDGREMITTSQVVFVDLGSEDNVQPGDRLTIYRRPGTGNITRFRDKEVTPSASGGFESDRFRGGKYSIKAGRVSDPTDSGLRNPPVSTPGVKARRPAVPRKVIGEAIVLRAEKRTATVLITQVAQEVHTGDFVEVQ